MAAAFVANMFVFLFLLLTKNKKWLAHLFSLLLQPAVSPMALYVYCSDKKSPTCFLGS
jgi:hypothetical protein